MSLIETEALILKSYNLGDADKIIVMLTQREGLVRGVAKGAKRLKSKYGGSLEPFSIIDIEYFPLIPWPRLQEKNRPTHDQ